MFNLNLRLIFHLSILVLLSNNVITAEAFQNEFLKLFDLPEPRIINGTVASLEATRHQVSIRKKQTDRFFFGTGHICGGSLISENVVLSAAHCFVNYNIEKPKGTFHPDDYFIAVMGELDRFNISNNTLKFDIVKIVKPVEIFNLQTYQHDIVLLILNGKVPANHPTVRPITLNDSPLANNTLCQVTGWGKTEKGFESDILLTLDVPLIDSDDCRKKTLYETLVTEGMICAGYLEGEKDSCTGDSGGPLTCREVQAGIISWGSGCAKPLSPGVFTNVSFYKSWILEEVAKHNGTLPKFAGDAGNRNDVGKSDSDSNGQGNCVTIPSRSLTLISLMIILNYCLTQIK